MLGLKTGKRDKLRIYYDILAALGDVSHIEGSCLTRVAHRANLPYDRFYEYLRGLVRLDMVSKVGEGRFFVTRKGLEYAKEFERMDDVLSRMGLSL